ncbi:S1 family peptidase [Nocardiopsis composta]|uniref:Streptogrisin C n=1 Tax=Nocardiopsis composta TaxID=157465 RepID=A0A7W8QJE7_9ACTN|nr:alpha-lytic protease prodomain-containing protein [Nocardiopsis composta]MBB5431506.1 streptogrisin C [Nocardiopsis composta]
MRKSPYIPLLGASVLALGMIAASPTAASADEATDSSPARALASGLDMSTAQAAELLDAEAQARTAEQEARELAGASFAGAVFDADTRKLTVSVTDAAAAEAVQATGAETRVVEASADELDAAVADLNAEERGLGSEIDGVTGWYVDQAANELVVTVLDGETEAAETLLDEAGVDSVPVRVDQGAEQPETFGDIVGGNAYYPGGSRCSIGFSVQGGFATAGHCGSQGTRVTGGAGESGTVAGSIFPGRDMGWVRVNSGWNPSPYVNNYSGGRVLVTGSQEASVGASVCRSGSTTGWRCGTIQAKNQTVRYPEGTVNGLTRTTACAEPGDSGGSWLSGNQAQGVTSGGSGNCSSGGTTFFQPLNPILSQWGLTLTTG